MYRGSGPRVLPIIIVIIVVALLIAALVTVGRMIFSGNGSESKENTGASLQDAVLDRTASRSVRWTVRGSIVADEKFRSYQITVSPSSRSFVTYSGYLDQVMDTKTYDNNAAAYEEFVYALDKAEIAKTRKGEDADMRGVCATKGLAYMFETMNNANVDNSIWTSSCKDSPGTMAADPYKVHALFVNQIPDFKPLFNDIF